MQTRPGSSPPVADPRRADGRITNRNYRGRRGGEAERSSSASAATDTHRSASSREVEHAATVAAAGVGVGAEVVAFLRPRATPHSVHPGHRRWRTWTSTHHTPSRGSPIRSAGSTRAPAIPACFIPLRIWRGSTGQLAVERGVRIPSEYALAQAIGRRIELALITNPLEGCALPQDFLPAT